MHRTEMADRPIENEREMYRNEVKPMKMFRRSHMA
jgi:hypothetical protein